MSAVLVTIVVRPLMSTRSPQASGISLCLSVCEWSHVRSHRPVAGYATSKTLHCCSLSQHAAGFFYWCVCENEGHWMDFPTTVAFLHSRDNPHCMHCDYAIAICVSMVSSYYWEEGMEGWHCDLWGSHLKPISYNAVVEDNFSVLGTYIKFK